MSFLGKTESTSHAPFDVELEQRILGLAILDNTVIETLAEVLAPEHFYDPLHGRIFAYMTMMRAEEPGRVLSPITLYAALRGDPGVKELSVSGHQYFASLAQSAPSGEEVRVLAKMLVDLAARRDLMRAANDMLDAVQQPPHEMATTVLFSRAMQDLEVVHGDWERATGQAQVTQSKERSEAVLRDMEHHDTRPRHRVYTGLQSLDAFTGGMAPADLVILCGRSGMAKSALAGCVSFRASEGAYTPLGQRAEPVPTLVISLEMTGEQWVQRMLCDAAYDAAPTTPVNYSNFRTGRFTKEERERLAEAQVKLSALPLEIHDEGSLSIAQIGAKARAFKARHGGKLGLVIVDYLQKIEPDGRERSREQEVTAITVGLKRLAKSLGWPVLALAQVLTKGGDRSKDTMEAAPSLRDLRESGAIEIEADLVLSVFRKARSVLARKPEALPDSVDMLTWQGEYNDCKNLLQVAGLKSRHTEEFKVDLWCEIGASAIRDRKPQPSWLDLQPHQGTVF